MNRLTCFFVATMIALCGCGGLSGLPDIVPVTPPVADPLFTSIDLASFAPTPGFLRLSGSASTGRFGMPVAAGVDCNGDGHEDFALSAMQAAPFGRTGAGQGHLVFGNGTGAPSRDTAIASTGTLVIAGVATAEATGNLLVIGGDVVPKP